MQHKGGEDICLTFLREYFKTQVFNGMYVSKYVFTLHGKFLEQALSVIDSYLSPTLLGNINYILRQQLCYVKDFFFRLVQLINKQYSSLSADNANKLVCLPNGLLLNRSLRKIDIHISKVIR